MQFYLPSNPQACTFFGGQYVVPVRVQDTGEYVDNTLCYAYAVLARVYLAGQDPGQQIPGNATALQQVDAQNHIWQADGVPAAQCSQSGSANTLYVWARYQKPGMPPVFRDVRHSYNFQGTC